MRKYLLLLLLSVLSLGLCAQSSLYQRYINKYSGMAVDQMNRYGIPASITLAQGLLESAAGTSRLATKGNNHFGIKCHNSWRGPYMLVNDDAPNEKFRVYRNASESYEDHSKFLKNGRRYAFLFDLSKNDYKGWAKGLKKAGYATNPRYAYSLIEIIEKYSLHSYDKGRHKKRSKREERRYRKAHPFGDYVVHRCNGQYYVIAQAGDTYESLAKQMRNKEKNLRKYNEVDENYRLQTGDIVYLGKKSKEVNPTISTRYHVMQPGESLYSISQNYGVRLKTIQSLNRVKRSYRFKVGDLIRIKK